eukprot:scaffold155378_cov13-Tisochrysis_lutea.AAC.1
MNAHAPTVVADPEGGPGQAMEVMGIRACHVPRGRTQGRHGADLRQAWVHKMHLQAKLICVLTR